MNKITRIKNKIRSSASTTPTNKMHGGLEPGWYGKDKYGKLKYACSDVWGKCDAIFIANCKGLTDVKLR